MKITENYLKKLKPKDKRYTVAIGESLYLRVSPSGCKSWVLRYSFHSRVKDLTLGHHPELSLIQAKQKAHLKRKELAIKPSHGLTFADAFRLWKSKKKGFIVSYQDEVSRIETHLMPRLGRLPLDEVDAPTVLTVVEPLMSKLPTLKRCLMRLNEIMNLAVFAGLIQHNPCANLSRIFPTHSAEHHAYIEAKELGRLFDLLVGEPLWLHCFVLFCVYTALRPGEVTALKWSYIEGDVLTVPAELMKKRRQHRVPLCSGVLALLDVTRKIKKRTFIWCFSRSNRVSKQYLTKWLFKSPLKGELTHHGLRSTLRTYLIDKEVSFEVAEDALSHVSLTQTERAYIRVDFLEQRRKVMAEYFDFIFKQYCAVMAGDPVAKPLIDAVTKVLG